MLREQIEEFVCYGGEFQRFVSFLSGYIDFIENQLNENLVYVGNEDLKKKVQRVMIFFVFVYYVSVVWLGKNGKVFIVLVGLIISDFIKVLDVFKINISVKWF